jgi:hypothetical protein
MFYYVQERRRPVIEVRHIPMHANDHADRWLMQTVLEHSSSYQAREVAAAWLDAYDAALALGAAAPQAHVLADAAYRACAVSAGLPDGARRSA